jgi:hypothetical protein
MARRGNTEFSDMSAQQASRRDSLAASAPPSVLKRRTSGEKKLWRTLGPADAPLGAPLGFAPASMS